MFSCRCLASTAWVMADVAMHMRHRIDDDSPFSTPTWRDEVRGVSITLRGYDTVLCEEVAANHFYYAEDGGIVEGRRFSDANTRASMASLEYGLQGGKKTVSYTHLTLPTILLV